MSPRTSASTCRATISRFALTRGFGSPATRSARSCHVRAASGLSGVLIPTSSYQQRPHHSYAPRVSTVVSPVDDRAVRVLAWMRLGLGVVAFVAPSLPARPWIGEDAGRGSARTLARALGARQTSPSVSERCLLNDTVGRYGAGSKAPRLADGGDAIATLIGWGTRPRFGRVAVLAAASGGALACRPRSPVASRPERRDGRLSRQGDGRDGAQIAGHYHETLQTSLPGLP